MNKNSFKFSWLMVFNGDNADWLDWDGGDVFTESMGGKRCECADLKFYMTW